MARKDKKTEVKDKKSAFSEIADKFKQNPALYIGSVLILLLVSVTFLAGDILFRRTGSDDELIFGYYDKVPIKWVPGNAFAQYQENAVRYYQSQGIEINDFSIAAQIWRQAYETTVIHTAILQMLKRSEYSIPERVVDRQVALLPQFQENGRFSSILYNQLSESQRTAIWRYEHDEYAKRVYFDDYFGLLTPSGEADFISEMSSDMRAFDMVLFNIEDYPESEYLTYARQNADLFRSIHLSKITINSSEREAVRVLDSIREGTITFEDAARAQSQDAFADRGGDMGSRYSYDLVYEIPVSADRENILRLRRGEISDVIRIGDSWVFFRVEDEVKAPDFEDDVLMDRVRSYLRNFDRGRMEDWAISQAREFIADMNVVGFDDAALSRNLGKHTFGPLPINYGSVDLFTSLEMFPVSVLSEQDLQYMSRNENFWRVAFSTPMNTASAPIVQGNNVLVLFPVEQVILDESMRENTSLMYSSYWLYYISEMSLQYYFLNNPRMDDRFWETYFRVFW